MLHPALICRRTNRGITLIELLIAVVIIAVLAAVALPSFFDSIYKSRRTDAFTAISAVQLAQERWRSNNASYNSNLSAAPTDDPPGLGFPATTAGGYYTISLSGASGTGYTVSAVAVTGTSQARDTACVKMAARMTGGQLSYAGCNDCSLEATDFSPANACWSR